MSHFSVLIVLPGTTKPEHIKNEIERRMEPWDENRRVEPYRSYEEGAAEDYWFVTAMRRGAEEHRADSPVEIRDSLLSRDGKTYRNGVGYVTRDEYIALEKADRADCATWADRLGEHPTWGTVAQLYNEKYGHGKELAAEGDESDSETLHYDQETGCAYTWSTYNPESKWDYWRIGGRWGGYFRVTQNGPGLITSPAGWDSSTRGDDGVQRVDGGPKRLLDFEAMRAEAGERANSLYDKWDAICADTPAATAWPDIASLAQLGDITWDEARRRYREQPRIAAAQKVDELSWGDCPVVRFMSGREEFVAEERRGAVPGYALVTLDEEWVAPGRMGWFGMSSDGPGERSGYRIAVNRYLDDKVTDDDFVIALDCHI